MKNQNAKITPKKAETVSSLTDLISKAKSIAVVDYSKMTPAQSTQLRRDIRASGGEMKVTKNTLFRVALKKADFKIEGLNAFIFAIKDEVSPLKTVADFIKKNNILSFRMGLYGDKVLNASEIEALAKTPTKEASVGKFMYLLNFYTGKLARTIDAIAKSKGGETS